MERQHSFHLCGEDRTPQGTGCNLSLGLHFSSNIHLLFLSHLRMKVSFHSFKTNLSTCVLDPKCLNFLDAYVTSPSSWPHGWLLLLRFTNSVQFSPQTKKKTSPSFTLVPPGATILPLSFSTRPPINSAPGLTSVLPLEKVRDFQTTKSNRSDLSGFLTSSPVNLALSLAFLTTCIFLGELPHFLSLTYWRRCARFTTLVTFPAASMLCSSCTSYSPW